MDVADDQAEHKNDDPMDGAQAFRIAGDELLMELLAQGWTHQRTAAAVGVSTKTIQRRMVDPDFSAAVSSRRRQRVAQLSGQLILASDRAVEVLQAALESDDPKVTLRAAALVLDHGHRYQREDAERELAQRQDELEQRMQDAIAAMTGLVGGTQLGGGDGSR